MNKISDICRELPLRLGNDSFDGELFPAHKFIENWDKLFAEAVKLADPFISPHANIHPSAIIGDNVFIDDDVYVGPNCYLRSNVILKKGVHLGFSVELDRIVLCENVKIAHVANLGRAIVGRDCNIAYGNVVATKNLKGKIKAYHRDAEYFLSEAKHHGCVLGDGVITGVNVSFMPGSSVRPGTKIFPGTIVKGIYV